MQMKNRARLPVSTSTAARRVLQATTLRGDFRSDIRNHGNTHQLRGSRDFRPRWNRELGTLRLAAGAQVFDHPFVAGDGLGHRLFHQLLFGVDGPAGSRRPMGPAKDLGDAARIGRLGAGVDLFTMVVFRTARIGSAELFVLDPPDDDLNLLLLADQTADRLAVVAASTAAATQQPLTEADARQLPAEYGHCEAGQDCATSEHDEGREVRGKGLEVREGEVRRLRAGSSRERGWG